MTQAKAHIKSLEPGDRFTFWPGGPVFKRVQGPDNRVWIQDEAGNQPVQQLYPENGFVHAIDPFVKGTHG